MPLINPRPLSRLPTKPVNTPFTMLREIAVEPRLRLWHGAAMAPRTTQSGGFLLMTAILLGTIGGLMLGNPMQGVLTGTGVGIAAAVVVWLLDRRRA